MYAHALVTGGLLALQVSARDFPNCRSGPLASNQVCNATLDAWSRATALVAALTVSEKIANSGDKSPGASRLGLPAYEWWNEALHGVARSRGVTFADGSGNFSYATSFPQPVVLGAAFDPALVRAVAAVVSAEARAFADAGRSGLNFWTPNVNPLRDPRWGRGQEVPGEDAFAVSEYVRALIPALQGQDQQAGGSGGGGGGGGEARWTLVATCKHFAGYDLENWKGNKRYGFDAVITRADLQDYYLAPFRACVRDAGARSVMCSYNAVNGVPTCADPWLLQSVLREQWGFDDDDYDGSSSSGGGGGNGTAARWVTADCDALANVWTDHHYGRSAADAAARSLNAGTDLDCGDFWPKNLAAAHDGHLFTDAALDRSLVRRYASLVRLGWFDGDRRVGWEAVATPEATALALRAATEGLVLLKNGNASGVGALPLRAGGAGKKVAVLGPLGSATTQMQGSYSGIARRISSVASAFRDAGWSVTAVQGCDVAGSATSGFAAALAAARAADVVIFVGGLDNSVEAEDRDREQITWPGQQLALIKQLASAAQAGGGGSSSSSSSKPPFVVVQMGTMVDSSTLEAEKGVDALLWAGYPGQDGGKAIVNTLLGQSAPAGRLPVTQYPAAYVDQVKMTDMNLQPGNGNPGRTYKWYTGDPIYPFGHGLHYTSFNVSFLPGLPTSFTTSSLVSNTTLFKYPDQAPFFPVPVSVTNTGNVTSDYVVLAFAKGEYGPSPHPKKSSVGFSRLHGIEPGNKATATLDLRLGSIARSDAQGNLVLWPGKYSIVVDIDERDQWSFEVTGDQATLEKLAPKT